MSAEPWFMWYSVVRMANSSSSQWRDWGLVKLNWTWVHWYGRWINMDGEIQRLYHLSSTSECPDNYKLMRSSKLGRNFDCPVTTLQMLIWSIFDAPSFAHAKIKKSSDYRSRWIIPVSDTCQLCFEEDEVTNRPSSLLHYALKLRVTSSQHFQQSLAIIPAIVQIESLPSSLVSQIPTWTLQQQHLLDKDEGTSKECQEWGDRLAIKEEMVQMEE